jgi:hypothetical protein
MVVAVEGAGNLESVLTVIHLTAAAAVEVAALLGEVQEELVIQILIPTVQTAVLVVLAQIQITVLEAAAVDYQLAEALLHLVLVVLAAMGLHHLALGGWRLQLVKFLAV